MSADPYIRQGRVLTVVDGDTVKVVVDLGFFVSVLMDVRVHGINAPEKSTPDGQKSLARALQLLPVGTLVTVQTFGPDKYGGRWLGSIALPDGRDFAQILLDEHLALPWDGHGPKPTASPT